MKLLAGVVEVRLSVGEPARLLIDGEEFSYLTLVQTVGSSGEDDFPYVDVRIYANEVRTAMATSAAQA